MINNILKKIEKANEVQNVELEKHEVELNLLGDIFEFIKNYSVFHVAEPVTKAAEKAERDLNIKKEKLQNIIKEIERGKLMVKELGLPLKEFENMEVMANHQMKITNTILKKVQSAKFVDNI